MPRFDETAPENLALALAEVFSAVITFYEPDGNTHCALDDLQVDVEMELLGDRGGGAGYGSVGQFSLRTLLQKFRTECDGDDAELKRENAGRFRALAELALQLARELEP